MAATAEPEGLRERKKRARRKQISDVAMRLFSKRGFDHVTVAEVAAAADVSEKTVYNYFATKEDLVFDEDQARAERYVSAVRDRPAGVSILDSLGEVIGGWFTPERAAGEHAYGATMWRLIEETPALQRRAHEMHIRHTEALAGALAAEQGREPSVLEWALASIFLHVEFTLLMFATHRRAEGLDAQQAAAEARRETKRILALLGRGLADYGSPGGAAAAGRARRAAKRSAPRA